MLENSSGGDNSQIISIESTIKDSSVSLLANVLYKRVGNRPLHLHLLVPNEAKDPLPLICWIQGCAFGAFGPQDTFLRLPDLVQLAKNGYVVASIEHRLSHEAVFPAQIEDVKAAVQFLKEHAEEYSIDPNRVGAWGNSSGGYMVAFLGASAHIREFDLDQADQSLNSSIHAVVDWYGPTDFLQMSKYPSSIDHDASNSPESLFIGYPIQEHPELVQQANPITYITEDTPPFLIMHGDQDDYVPYNQSELLFEALQQKGLNPIMYRVAGAGHGTGFGEDQLTIVQRFFAHHLSGISTYPQDKFPL